jgi:hypothetical protein
MSDLASIAAEVPTAEARTGVDRRTRLSLRAPPGALDHESRHADNGFPPADELDALAALMIPNTIAKGAPKLVEAQAERLFREGARGATARALLSRDISAGRAHLALFEALLDAEVQRVGRGKDDVRKARLYADLADRQHRRLVLSMELLHRLDAPSIPAVSVRADHAAFLVSSEVRTQTG